MRTSPVATAFSSLSDEELAELYAWWRLYPDEFARDVLNYHPTPFQIPTMRAIARSLLVALRSGHKIGKSDLAAVIAIWFWFLFSHARVILTAPTGHQIEDVVWRAVRQRFLGAPVELGGTLYDTPYKGLQLTFGDGEQREIKGLSTSSAEAFSGISSPNVLYIGDEASGIPKEIFEAIHGNRAGQARLLLLGNPTQPDGEFYDAFHSSRSIYVTHHVDSAEVAEWNETGERDEFNVPMHRVPGLATKVWLNERETVWIPGTPVHDIRIRGNFPAQGVNQVIPLALIERAHAGWPTHLIDHSQPLEIGVDVAREGDDETVFAPKRGLYVWPLYVHRGAPGEPDPNEAHKISDALIDLLPRWLRPGEGRMPGTVKPIVKVDVIGWGSGVRDVLANGTSPKYKIRYSELVDVVGVNVAETADDATSYVNLRSQLSFGLRDFLARGGVLPPDERLDEELRSPRYDFDSAGRHRVEEKKYVKERLGRSPDRFDAVALAVYGAASRMRYGATRDLHLPGI